ncbi:hypothetical protein ACIBP6_08470 [Nonomuraea terrae]|uniref:hypothetical protein n=1 Tax=Nonomuraea terrae TaxID=2530383 RepID=UPI0037ACFD87
MARRLLPLLEPYLPQPAIAILDFLIQEQSVGIHYHQGNDVLDHLIDPAPLTFEAGCARRATRPGLGIEIDERGVERAAERGQRRRDPDGSFAAW